MARVDLQRISKSYPGLKVLDDVSLSIRSGEFFTLLGPSGCGKTTLLRTVAGFNKQDEGKVLVDGAGIDDVPAHRRNIGMVYQDYAIFPHLTVADNVAFGLLMRGVPRTRDRRAHGAARSTWSSWGDSAPACRTSCPGDSSSAWRSPARWWSTRRSS